VPSLTEWKVTAGVWALGLMIYTVALKVALPVLTGEHTRASLGPPGSPSQLVPAPPAPSPPAPAEAA
jgi:molybdopterin-containing oxidoreductase family membrane subunit